MENFTEVKERILNNMIEKGNHEHFIKRVKDCGSWDELKEFIVDNIWWCIDDDIELPDGYYKSNKCEFTIVNSQLHGEYKSWDSDGELFEKCFYKNGKLDGEYKQWWPFGKLYERRLKEHSYYKDGKIVSEDEWLKSKKVNHQLISHHLISQRLFVREERLKKLNVKLGDFGNDYNREDAFLAYHGGWGKGYVMGEIESLESEIVFLRSLLQSN
jgi:hypothetical protein